MEVVLLERIRHLGQMGDVVDVKKGYARNFLLPQGKALRSTPANRERFELERANIEARDLELRGEAEHAAEKISGLQIDVIRQASEAGTLYGSVSSRDIAAACREQSVNVERRQIELERPIKSLGMHAVQVVLHPEVTVPMVVCVARSQEEAQLQSRSIEATVPAEQQLDADLTVAAEQQAKSAASDSIAPSDDGAPTPVEVEVTSSEASASAPGPATEPDSEKTDGANSAPRDTTSESPMATSTASESEIPGKGETDLSKSEPAH